MVKRIKLRTLLIGGIITLFFTILIAKLFWIQVVKSDEWTAYAQKQYSRNQVISASRGTITDRNGDVLAVDVPAYNISLNSRVINAEKLQDDIVKGLHEILGKPEDQLRALLDAKNKEGKFFLQREVRTEGWNVDQEVRVQIEQLRDRLMKEHKLKDVGIIITRDKKRFYPKDSRASHVLGYVNREGNAVAGLEAYYDKELKGINGSIAKKTDNIGVELSGTDTVYTAAVDGKNIQLTIDDQIQYYIEEAMKEAYKELDPISMTVIAADPNTMEILGMANMPTFNPNEFWMDVDQKNFYNHAIKSTYEPGSTFKIVTLSGAVEEGLFDPNAEFMSGSIKVKGATLHDNKRAGWGSISYLEGLKRSSNVAFVKLGEMLGEDRFRNYITNFGFGQKTGIELPGEVSGRISFQYPSEVATAAYGHGRVQVTPIQQVAAVAAVANGGKLLEPHIVKSITDPTTGKKIETEPKLIRQVISEEHAAEVGSYLEQVVSDQIIGTGRHAYIEGYRVAGKTGTAVKVVNGVYDYDKQVVSFIGYAPVDDPKILMLVLVDEPRNTDLGGGAVAAPIFKKIVTQVLQYMHVPKSDVTNYVLGNSSKVAQNLIDVPDLRKLSLTSAKEQLVKKGISFETLGTGTEVISQFPKVGSRMKANQRIYLLTEEGDAMDVPDLTGESLRGAMEVLSLMKVSIATQGEGYVVNQVVSQDGDRRLVSLTLQPLTQPTDNSTQEVDGEEGPVDGEEVEAAP